MAQTKEEKNAKERNRYHNHGGKQKLQKKRSTPESKEQRKAWYKERGNELEKNRRSTTEFKVKATIIRDKPENKEKQRKRDADPTRKAKQAIADASPERKTKTQIRRIEKREIVLKHYSKKHSNSDIPCCRCCGENEHIAFLDLDHVDGKKAMESNIELVKKGYSSKLRSQKLFHWIINNDFPDGFQVLCKNCNGAKSLLGKCPHQK